MPTVIKAGETGRLATRLNTIDLADHVREAQGIMERALEEAATIISAAKASARQDLAESFEKARKEGFEKGYAEGETSGREEALERGRQAFAEQHASLAEMFRAGLEEIEANKVQLRLAAERDLLEFAVAIATKLTFEMGELHREAAKENFARALALVSQESDVTVRCHPKDIHTLRTFAESLTGPAGLGRHVHLAADESIRPGGCVLRCGKAEVDATLETQIAELVTALMGERNRA